MEIRGKLVALSAAIILAVQVSGCTGKPSNNNSSESNGTSVATSEKAQECVLEEPEIVEYSDNIGVPVVRVDFTGRSLIWKSVLWKMAARFDILLTEAFLIKILRYTRKRYISAKDMKNQRIYHILKISDLKA